MPLWQEHIAAMYRKYGMPLWQEHIAAMPEHLNKWICIFKHCLKRYHHSSNLYPL